ncbi:hypothetical protein GCM10010246_72890 [Streptomyces cuspidosporus]|uniref:Uncharacterized protein n=1 Tax=Streptomyces cuspidosporus TaxID=66882 RepID=A0ABN3H491_9ACTN
MLGSIATWRVASSAVSSDAVSRDAVSSDAVINGAVFDGAVFMVRSLGAGRFGPDRSVRRPGRAAGRAGRKRPRTSRGQSHPGGVSFVTMKYTGGKPAASNTASSFDSNVI